MLNKFKNSGLFSVYILGFFFAFHTALPTYINSSFLGNFLPENSEGTIYIIASIFTIFCFLIMPYILGRFGNYKTTISLVALDFIALLGLAVFKDSFWLLFFFVLNLITIPLIYFSTDIFLESFSKNTKTGGIRGIYLTAVNSAWVFAPSITGFILKSSDNDYWKVYLASLIFLLPIVYILVFNLRKFKDSKYEVINIWKTMSEIRKNKDLFNIVLAAFVLFFFYAFMTIHLPIYLNVNIGFSFKEIGLIISVALLPFVLFQSSLGRLADQKLGEKELLSLGFIIMALSVPVISFVTEKNMLIWMVILFITRIGASMVEVMCDTYFFKKVDSLDANVISFYRMLSPFAYVVCPLFAYVMLNFSLFDIKYLSIAIGLIMLVGLKASLSIKDTK